MDKNFENIRNHPLFTIITPSFNQGRFIRQTIESVMSQNLSSLEHLIIDGGSNDETLSVLRSFGDSIQWQSEPDSGQAHAINKGLSVARGDIIGWLNSDDIYYPGTLMTVSDIFSKHPDIDIIYGMADHIGEDGAILRPYFSEEWNYERLKEYCFICQPAVFFRRGLIEKFGLLDEKLNYCMDYEYWLRIGREISFYYVKQKFAGSRLHDQNKTIGSTVAVHEEILNMLRDKIGSVSAKWIFGHARAVTRSERTGGKQMRILPSILRFMKVFIQDSFRLKRYLTLPSLQALRRYLFRERIKT